VKEAFYALHHLKGIVRDSRIRALPVNLWQWAEKFAAIDDADLIEDFWRIQTQIVQVLHEDVNLTGGVMHCGIALTNREIEERLNRQRDTRTFMTREDVRPFPTRTTWCLWLASGVGSMYRKLYYPSIVSELLLDMCV
jgi:hypothetical protein